MMMTKLELAMTNNELEARVIELETGEQQMRLELAELKAELAEAENIASGLQIEVEFAHAGHEHTCRRCYATFVGPLDAQYCNRDCEYFRPQEPFSTLLAKLEREQHPNGRRGQAANA